MKYGQATNILLDEIWAIVPSRLELISLAAAGVDVFSNAAFDNSKQAASRARVVQLRCYYCMGFFFIVRVSCKKCWGQALSSDSVRIPTA
jgi:hypothetical protein